MRYISILTLFVILSYGESVNLNSLIENIEQIRLIDKSIEEEAKALEAESLSSVADEPFVVSQSISQVGTSFNNLKNSIDTSLSRDIKLKEIKELEKRRDRLRNEAYIVGKRADIISFKNSIALMYHQYCLGESYLNSYQSYYNNIEELYRKKLVAYNYNDIAKTELLQVEFEKSRQSKELENLTRKQQNSREQLLRLGGFVESDTLSCLDLHPITLDIQLDENLFPISKEVYQKEQSSIEAGIERYSKKIEGVTLSIGYNYDVDTNYYTVGVEVPLEFTSRRNEHKRVSLMYQHSANETKHKLFVENRLFKIKRLGLELKSIVQKISGIEESIDSFKSKLLPLIKKSYDYGESSVTEYLLTRQKLNLLEREILDAKRDYYNKLFNIYELNEKEDI
jgi:hypothetical protein